VTHDSGDRGDAPPEGALRRSGVDLSVSVDDLWLHEWAVEGLERLEGFLTTHAAFDEFLGHRNNGGDDDDGR
jgi:hypothetical protein